MVKVSNAVFGVYCELRQRHGMHSKPYGRPRHSDSNMLLILSDNKAALPLLKKRRRTQATKTTNL